MSRLGTNLKLLRKRRGLSQIELGRLSGITERTIYNYESGENYPKSKNLAKLARALEVSEDVLEWAELEQELATELKPMLDRSREDRMLPRIEQRTQPLESELLDRATHVFTSNELSEATKDDIFEAIAQVYFMSKRRYRMSRR